MSFSILIKVKIIPEKIFLSSIYSQSLASCRRKCVASEEIDRVLDQLFYESDCSELSWNDVSINRDNLIVHRSNGTSTDSKESQSVTLKPTRCE